MAMNLLNPIQLLCGSSGAIAAAQGKEGTLYYDTQRGNLITRGATAVHTFPRVVSEDNVQPTIYVDAANGDDNNSGFSAEEPVKTLDKALWLCNTRIGLYPTIIQLADGTYAINEDVFPDCIIQGSSRENTIINVSYFGKLYGYIELYDCTIRCSSAYYDVIFFTYGTNSNLRNVKIEALSDCATVFYCGDSGYANLDNCEIYGNNITVTEAVLYCNFCSAINTNNIDLSGSFNVTGSVVTAGGNSNFIINQGTHITNSGQVTGKRYYAYGGSVIDTGGAGANVIPGTLDGYTINGGGYY